LSSFSASIALTPALLREISRPHALSARLPDVNYLLTVDLLGLSGHFILVLLSSQSAFESLYPHRSLILTTNCVGFTKISATITSVIVVTM
jgi:hypothetical protein